MISQNRGFIVKRRLYLITVTDDLNNVTSKATKTLSFLNLTLARKETKVAAYKALVRPQLEYAAPVWNPHHQTEINRIEKFQMTAARWTCSYQSYVGEMLDELQCPELQERRQQASLTFFYTIHNNLVTIDKKRYLPEASRGNRSTRPHPFQYHCPNAYTDGLTFSFTPGQLQTCHYGQI